MKSKKRLSTYISSFPNLDYLNLKIIFGYDGNNPNFPFYKYKKYASIYWGNRKNQNDFKPGAFCCYLSHRKVWNDFLSYALNDLCIVTEDDSVIDPILLHDLFAGTLPKEFDIIFINKRVVNWIDLTNIKPSLNSINGSYYKASELFLTLALNKNYKNIVPSNGTDGYILSLKGAKKLQKMMEKRGICMDIDYALTLNSLEEEKVNTIIDANISNSRVIDLFMDKLKLSNTNIDDITLKSYVYNKNIISLRNAPSDIDHSHFISKKIFDINFPD